MLTISRHSVVSGDSAVALCFQSVALQRLLWLYSPIREWQSRLHVVQVQFEGWDPFLRGFLTPFLICLSDPLPHGLPPAVTVLSNHLPISWADVARFLVPFTNILESESWVPHWSATCGKVLIHNVLWDAPIFHRQAKLSTGMREAVDQPLESSVIGRQHLPDQYFGHLGFGAQTGHVEEAPV